MAPRIFGAANPEVVMLRQLFSPKRGPMTDSAGHLVFQSILRSNARVFFFPRRGPLSCSKAQGKSQVPLPIRMTFP